MFNVLREPWIPVVSLKGEQYELGILDVLHQAHELADIVDPSPLVRFGIHRLLSAFVLDALRPQTLDDLGGLLDQGCFNTTELDRYTQKCGHCFNLFDAEQPFLQSSKNSTAGQTPTSISVLAQHIPSGSNAVHFHHGGEEAVAFSPAACTRLLTTMAPFMTAGGAGNSPSINGIPPWYVLIAGPNLHQSLTLNICVLPCMGVKFPGEPAWRTDAPVIGKQPRSPSSELECLTWRPRLVRLLPTDNSGNCAYLGQSRSNLVRTTVFAAGFKAENPDALWRDPAVGYRLTKKGVYPIRPQADQEIWRDVGPLALLTASRHPANDGILYDRPRLVSQFAELQARDIIDRDQAMVLDCCSLRTDGKMKIFEWIADRLAVPPSCLRHPTAGDQVRLAMDLASRAADVLGRAVRATYPRGGGGNAKMFDRRRELAVRTFWTTLRHDFDGWFIPTLAVQDPANPNAPGELHGGWVDRVVRRGHSALDLAIDDLDADANALRRQVDARGNFEWFASRARKQEGVSA